MREHRVARRLYRQLLSFYPKDFRDRVGRSMEQTFADNLREGRRRGGHLFGFLVWTYAETIVGAMRQRARRTIAPGWVAVVGGLVLVVPLMALEWTTRSERPRTDFAFPLFVFLWLLTVVFIRMLFGVVRGGLAMRAGDVGALRGSMSMVARVALLGWIGWVWVSWVVDQWPCFLGASGC